MSNVVQFLEALARNPKPLQAEAYATTVANAQLDPATKQALLSGDIAALNHAIGASQTLLCFVVPAENDEPEEGDEQQEYEEESPNKESSARAA